MNVRNMTSKSGNKIANQFIIEDGNKTYFQSYDSMICMIEDGRVTLDEVYWAYSTTTGKYRNIFLNETIRETRTKIDAGFYKLANLN